MAAMQVPPGLSWWVIAVLLLAALAAGIGGTLYVTRRGHGRGRSRSQPRPGGAGDPGARGMPVRTERIDGSWQPSSPRRETREPAYGSQPLAPASRSMGGREAERFGAGDDRVEELRAAVDGLRSELLALKGTAAEAADHERRIERLEAQLRPAPGRSAEAWREPAPQQSVAPAVEMDAYDPSLAGYGASAAAMEVPYGALAAEVKDDLVRQSDSYPPEAYLAPGPPARLFLNSEMKLSEAAMRRFQAFFDFPPVQGNSASFRTRTPAEVEWNGTQGTCRGRGTVEAL